MAPSNVPEAPFRLWRCLADTLATMTALPRSTSRRDAVHLLDPTPPAIPDPARPPVATGAVHPETASRVLLATDLRPASAAATAAAIGLAADLGASLVVMNVVEPVRDGPSALRVDQRRERNESAVQSIASEARIAGVDTTFLVWHGEPGPSIVAAAEAEAADIIVIGATTRPRVSRLLLGSVSEHILHAAHCPVLVVRPREEP
jgi:nucleotide-binding universal stress UspA family protein